MSKQQLKQRLREVIVLDKPEECNDVLREVRRHTFLLELEMDSAIVLHFCRCLSHFLQQQSDIDTTLALNIIRSILKTLPTARMLNEVVETSPDGSQSSLYDKVVPLVAAVMMRLPIKDYPQTEQLLISYLTGPDVVPALLLADVWCLLARAAEPLQMHLSQFLCRLAPCLPATPVRRHLLQRLIGFMDEEMQHSLFSTFNPLTNGLHFALRHLSQEKLQQMLPPALDRLFAAESCIVSDVEAVCHLLALLPQTEPELVQQIRELTASMGDVVDDQEEGDRLTECVQLLHNIEQRPKQEKQ